MFERFTDRARQVVVLAQEEARGLGHAYIGTEHLLLGMVREREGVAGQTLASLGVTLEGGRDAVRRIVGEGSGSPAAQIPFSPRAKTALELSLREAIRLDSQYIGTEHILLGLTRSREGAAVAVLLDAGADLDTIRDRVLVTLGPRATLTEQRRRWTRTRRGNVTMTPPRQCWEYRIEQHADIDTDWLNELGSAGWELVSVVPGPEGHTAIFKRRSGPGSLRAAG